MREEASQAARDSAAPKSTAMTHVELDALFGSLTLQMVRATFDEWTIGRTGGRLLAVRSGLFSSDGPRSLIRGHLLADTVLGLAEQLEIQAWLETLSPDGLEAVWRDQHSAVPA